MSDHLSLFSPEDNRTWDVVICGGGLAGLALARQLSLELPDRQVLVLDERAQPSPIAAFKVGESTLEVSTHYLRDRLQMNQHMDGVHLRKMGLRFFFPASAGFHERPEFGPSSYDPAPAFQVDRGLLENGIRALLVQSGMQVHCGTRVVDIELGQEDCEHVVSVVAMDGNDTKRIPARWVIDASGRRRILQKKLGLSIPAGHGCSAAWFRIAGRVDVSDFVPACRADWHARVSLGERYFSTNHLMGNGRWVWMIPLGSGCTSIGIVTREDVIPISSYNTYGKAIKWLLDNEPELGARIAPYQPLDFRCLRNYSYSSRQIFSKERWACVGDAGVFADPLFSPGIDGISIANSIVTDLIRRDQTSGVSSALIDRYNQYLIAFNDAAIRITQPAYHFFGRSKPMAAKLLWNTLAGWAVTAPQRFNYTYVDDALAGEMLVAATQLTALSLRMERVFADWAEQPAREGTFDFFDYQNITGVQDLYSRNVRGDQSRDELLSAQAANLRYFETLAQGLFRIALEDLCIELPDEFSGSACPWLNAWGIGLDPSRWVSDRLFECRTPTGEVEPLLAQLRAAFGLDRPRHPAGPQSSRATFSVSGGCAEVLAGD
ncbi:NAD(P)/FAD-dependent oxidoreductase [Bradyrhizobium sp. SZCCHNR1015]|uniref:NAD(P)/FAD-dependent oxidoreductase n=1 Tax=Bradyrhizobium sp. SZCCHNR1015 TaxID=3057338 RepID=UPI00291687A6|nr:tryptophan 7-halogenase [Bradyrhizobium sp. SZCCHNR1015]